MLPAQGFSLSELDDAGVNLELAERLGLPVDAGRIGTYGPNVTVLRTLLAPPSVNRSTLSVRALRFNHHDIHGLGVGFS